LFKWQELVIEGMLGLDEGGRWVTPDDGLDVARQNGKGVILQAVEGFCAFELGYPMVMHTAHEFATSQEHQLRLEAVIQDAPHLHARVKDRGGYMHANGKEAINLKTGERIVFKARTKGGGRGYSGDLRVWDEAMVLPDAVVGAQKPMTRASTAQHGQKTIFAGSAVDDEVHEYGLTFARIRARGLAHSPRVSWHEWSAPFEHPSALDDEAFNDRSNWLAANPSMAEGLISEQTMADELELMARRTAAVELFGVGAWPDPDASTRTVIDLDVWRGLQVGNDSQVVGQPCFAFDVAPDRSSAAIAVCGRNAEGFAQVEVPHWGRGTGWVVERVARMYHEHGPKMIVCSGTGITGTLVDELRLQGVLVTAVNATEYAQACAGLVDLVLEDGVRHLGSKELRDAIRGAATRPLGDAWAWSRKSSSVDISPLVAATLAVWGTVTSSSGEYVFDVGALIA
jgi:hypothetical protein